ncbi:MAG TPA: retropepsin-like aspartic protease [Candidatus Angelobacter sp.]|jgi:predicted aspartyl protease|nr:retropepsin-like aspartic protease [Candidatus Angelobacter sp.]
MSPLVDFSQEFQYRELENGLFPALLVTLIGPKGEEDLLPIIDTGATYCFFNGKRAASIGLDLTAGRHEHLVSLAGQLTAWIHEVDLEILGTRFHCEVAFSEHNITRELLGRHTLLAQVRIGFREGISTGYFHPTP